VPWLVVPLFGLACIVIYCWLRCSCGGLSYWITLDSCAWLQPALQRQLRCTHLPSHGPHILAICAVVWIVDYPTLPQLILTLQLFCICWIITLWFYLLGPDSFIVIVIPDLVGWIYAVVLQLLRCVDCIVVTFGLVVILVTLGHGHSLIVWFSQPSARWLPATALVQLQLAIPFCLAPWQPAQPHCLLWLAWVPWPWFEFVYVVPCWCLVVNLLLLCSLGLVPNLLLWAYLPDLLYCPLAL